jgi:protein-arginine kinase
MRASVHVKLPKLAKNEPAFQALAKDLGLSIRGINGEHSESVGGVYDISNKKRLGISEVESALVMYNGVKKLLEEERRLS